MSDSLNKINAAIKANTDENLVNLLKCPTISNKTLEAADLHWITKLLSWKNEETIQVFTETIAEWGKNASNREVLTEPVFVASLLNVFFAWKSEKTIVNTARAIGNVFYENEKAANFLQESNYTKIIQLLQENETKPEVLTKIAGLIINILATNEVLQKSPHNKGLLDVSESLLNKYLNVVNEQSSLFQYLLTIVGTCTDLDATWFSEKLCCTIIEIFKISQEPEVGVSCLEVLHSQAENENIKILLAQKGTCQITIELIEKYKNLVNDEDTRAVLKMACELIVLVLTGDECMNLLYDNGKGSVYKDMVKWLDSKDPDILDCAILAIGNFARNDQHCINMVKSGISKKLIELLQKFNTAESNIKIQHAILSTLKNLVIPPQNKGVVLEEGLIAALYPLVESDQHVVIFKLLGTFRMVIDGQDKTALDLITRKDLIERLVFWCYNSDHLGVRGEVPRLLAWLIKYCFSFKPFHNILQVPDSIKCIVEMVSSNHAVMQNEAFYALNLLCLGTKHSNSPQNGALTGAPLKNENNTDYTVLINELIKSEIGKHLSLVLGQFGDKLDKQSIENLLTLLEQLNKSDLLKNHLKENALNDLLSKLKQNSNALLLIDKIDKIIKDLV